MDYETKYTGITVQVTSYGPGKAYYFLQSCTGDDLEFDHYPITDEIKAFADQQREVYL